MFLTYKGTRRYLKQKLGGDIEHKAVEYVNSFIQTTLDDFCEEVKQQHEQANQTRKALGLREKKRFSKKLFIKVTPGIINQRTLFSSGEDGQYNGDTSSSGDNDFMETKNKSSCSKKAVYGVDEQ